MIRRRSLAPRRASLRHFARIVSGSGFPVAEQGHSDLELPFFKVKDLKTADQSGVLGTARDSITRETARDLRATVIPKGALAFAKVGAALLLGRVGALPADGCIDNNMAALIFKPSIDPEFARYLLLTFDFRRFVLPGPVPSLDIDGLREFQIPILSLHEQRAVADYLDQETAQIDALVAKQEELIALLRERRHMAIDRTLSSASDDSPRVRLKYMLLQVDQGVSPQAENGLVEGDDWGVLKTGCVNGGTFREREHKRLPGEFPVDRKLAVNAGDLIVSRANGTPSYVGSAALVEQIDLNLILSDKLFRLVPRPDVDARFLAWSMNSRAYRTQVEASISGAAGLANNLPLSDLRSFEFTRPELSAQKRIVESINEQTNAIDTLIVKAEEHIALAKERRSALITGAVTGQFDVRTARKAG